MLIVCEGSKAEPRYFGAIRQKWRISSLDWEILPSELGSGPEKVVEFAEWKAQKEDRWEEIYCVFDRDEHQFYDKAIAKAQSINEVLRKKGRRSVVKIFAAIPSDPCFELWFLIHFQDLTREEHRIEVRRILENHIPEYHKSFKGMFSRTINLLQEAYNRAEELRQRKITTCNSNPSTDVDILVKRLNAIGDMNPHKYNK